MLKIAEVSDKSFLPYGGIFFNLRVPPSLFAKVYAV